MRNYRYATPDADLETPTVDLPGRDYRWIQRAIGVAYGSAHHFPMGALAIQGGSLIGVSTNRFRNHPRITAWENCSTHAEQGLVDKYDISSAHVYVARIAADGSPAMAKPCINCLQALSAAGARRVIWTVDATHVGVLALG